MVLIVEPLHQGHHLYWLRLLTEECRRKGGRVTILTTSTAAESAEWRTHLDLKNLEVVLLPLSEFTLPDIAKVAADLEASVTVIPHADPHLLSVVRRGWAGPGNLKVLFMNAYGQRVPPFSWARPAKTVAKRVLIWAAGLQPGVVAYAVRSPLVHPRASLRWVADPVTIECSSQQIYATRNILEAGGSDYWVGVFGAITPRKNLPLIVESILDQPEIGLLIAGRIEQQVSLIATPLLKKFTANGGKLIHLPGPLSNVDFDSAIGAVDCVVVAQSFEGTSGVVIKSAALGRRLVLAGAESLRADATSLGDQATWSPLNVDALRQAIERARHAPEPSGSVELSASEFLRALI